MLTDQQIQRTRTLQERTGFNDWNNHMTCLQVTASVAEVTAAIEALSRPEVVEPRSHEAVLDVTWGLGGSIAVRCEEPGTVGPITISRPSAGASPEFTVVWLEASPLVCTASTLYGLGVELLAALGFLIR